MGSFTLEAWGRHGCGIQVDCDGVDGINFYGVMGADWDSLTDEQKRSSGPIAHGSESDPCILRHCHVAMFLDEEGGPAEVLAWAKRLVFLLESEEGAENG